MAIELGALEVPIRASGEQATTQALRNIDAAGQRTSQSLTRNFGAMAAQQRRTRQVSELLRREALRFTRVAEEQAGALSGVLTPALREYQKSIQDIQADLLRGRITEGEAARSALAAADVYRQQAAALTTTTRATQTTARSTAILTGASTRSAVGVRTLTGALANQAAVTLGVRSGLGSLVGAIGGLTLGALTTLGVVAGLAAVAFLIRQIGKAAREEKERLKEFREESQRLAESTSTLEEQRRLAIAAEREAESVLGTTEAKVREAEARAAATREQQRALGFSERAIATAPSVIAMEKRLTEATRDRTEAQEELTGRQRARIRIEEDIAQQGTSAADKAQKAFQEEVGALVDLANQSRATVTDLLRLLDIQDQLAASVTRGTAAQRAQTAALLDAVTAANRITAVVPLRLPGPTERREPGLRAPAAAPRVVAQQLDGLTALMQRFAVEGLGDLFAMMEQAPEAFEGFTSLLAQLEAAGQVAVGTMDRLTMAIEFKGMAEQVASLGNALLAGADAWLTFWEAIGSGQGLDRAFKGLIHSFARHMAQLYAAKGLAAIAESLLPPPLGNPKAAAAIAPAFAAAAAFAAIAGATGGGGRGSRGGGGGAGGSRDDFGDRDTRFGVQPRSLTFGAPSAARAAASLQPTPPVVYAPTIIGTNDPKAQQDIMRMIEQGTRRGYARA